jgi:hypothetical protein
VKRLPITQRNIIMRGRAIEVTVSAQEDPSQFTPSPHAHHDQPITPAGGHGVGRFTVALHQPIRAAELRLDDQQDHLPRGDASEQAMKAGDCASR